MAKTTININGQLNGNFKLLSAIGGNHERTQFNGFKIYFETKKEAAKAIRDAYNKLIQDEPESKNRIGGIGTNKTRTLLEYDASKAKINPDTH